MEPGSPSPIDIAFVGVSHPHAVAWARAAERSGAVRIAAVHDPDPQRAAAFADRFGSQSVSFDALVDHDLDAAIVDGRNDQTRDFSLAMIDRELPVLIEKPGGMSHDDLTLVQTRSEQVGVPTHLGYFMRYSASVVRAQELMATGTLGPITLARFHSGVPHRMWASTEWFSDSSHVRGTFLEAGSHVVDILRLLLGDPLSIAAVGAPSHAPENHAEGSITAALGFDAMTATISFSAHEADPWNSTWGFELFGERGTYRAGILPARSTITMTDDEPRVDIAGPDADTRSEVAAAEDDRMMDRSLAVFLESVGTGTPSPLGADGGAGTMSLIESIYHAAGR